MQSYSGANCRCVPPPKRRTIVLIMCSQKKWLARAFLSPCWVYFHDIRTGCQPHSLDLEEVWIQIIVLSNNNDSSANNLINTFYISLIILDVITIVINNNIDTIYKVYQTISKAQLLHNNIATASLDLARDTVSITHTSRIRDSVFSSVSMVREAYQISICCRRAGLKGLGRKHFAKYFAETLH